MSILVRLFCLVGLVALWPAAVRAQTAAPPLPALPSTIIRDAEGGRIVVRVVRTATPIRLDGRLDEAHYTEVDPFSDFVQMEPRGGQPATERTEVWLSYDDRNIYVSMRAWESDPSRMIANEMRRDSNNIRQGDSIGFSFDTFRDRRNAVQFEVNPLGGRTDGQSTNERQYNADWNPVWDVAVGTFPGGWTVEAAVPFKSLRYNSGREQVWGFQARRTNKWKNEISYLTTVPPAFGIGRGSFSASLFADAVGFEAPPQSLNLELKPYGVADVSTDRTVTPTTVNSLGADAGIDLKYAMTQGVTADFTYNTDFAQVEADEQQINLSRFNLFFPEKREFFLENIGLFAFGGVATTSDAGDTPIMFYSRRIGLNSIGNVARTVPILAGGRASGRIGRFTLGAVNIQTRDDEARAIPSTNFSVLRLKRDVLRRSSIGVIAGYRSATQAADVDNTMVGVDGGFAFFDNLLVNTYLARTRTAGVAGDDVSYRAQMDYSGDRYGLQIERLAVGANFKPEIGYVRRFDMRKNYAQGRFSPRSRSIRAVRKFSSIGTFNEIQNGAGVRETRIIDGEFALEMQNSDRFAIGANDDYEFLRSPFPIAPGVRIAPGAYRFATARVSYLFGQQRPVSGTLLLERGRFYGGERTTATFNRSRVNVTSQLSVEPSVSLNWVDLPEGSFTATVGGARITYTMTPLMFTSAFLQYNSSSNTVSANVRFRWQYRPGSEFFLVLNEERDTLAARFPATRNRSIVFKITHWSRL